MKGIGLLGWAWVLVARVPRRAGAATIEADGDVLLSAQRIEWTLDGPFALRPAEFSILLLVEANIGINQSQIGEALGVSPPNLVAVITRLIKRRLLRRSQSRQDRRVHHLHLTPAGAELLAQAVVEVDAFEADLSAALTAQELRVLRKALAKVSAR